VSETIEYEQFDHPDGHGHDGGGQATIDAGYEADLSRLSEIPMELSVEIGRTHMTVGETLDLRVGSVVTLERLAGETADLLVNGSAIARGEVVVIDEQYGLRITEILDGTADAVASSGAESGQTPSGDAQAAAASAGAAGAGAPAGGAPGAPGASGDAPGAGPAASAGDAPGAASAASAGAGEG
jgi:flagellar motor switch protein FliN/FliY